MKKSYIKPVVTVVNLCENLSVFSGCLMWADDADSCCS